MLINILNLSIKTKLTLIMCMLAIAGGALGLFALEKLGRDRARALVASHEFSLVERVTDDLDDKFEQRLEFISAIARQIKVDTISDSMKLDQFLSNLGATNKILGTTVVTDSRGMALGYIPELNSKKGTNYGDREWFKHVAEHKRSLISEPVVGRVSGLPQAVLAAPILDSLGNFVGSIAGTIELHDGFTLGDVNNQRIGRTGYFYIVSNERRFVAHRDRERIMTLIPEKGVNPSLDRALGGYEGTLEGVNSRGLHGLFSFKHMRSTGWLVAAVIPSEDAYIAVDAIIDTLQLVLAIGLIVILIVIWLGLWLFFSPLKALHNCMQSISEGVDPSNVQKCDIPHSNDEIGKVISGFNVMLDAINTRDQELRETHEHLHDVTKLMSYGVCMIGSNGKISFINPAAAQILRCSAHMTEGLFADDVIICKDSYGEKLLEDNAPWAVARETGKIQCHNELVLEDSNGESVPVNFIATPIMGDGIVTKIVVTFHDIAEQLQESRKLELLATHDSLTGLPNRFLLHDRIEQAVTQASRHEHHMALLYIDLDSFKPINDLHGHAAGDLVLQESARRMAARLRSEDTVARVGGDEFVVVLLKVQDRDCAQQMAFEVQQRIAERMDLDGIELSVSASVGIAIYPDDADSVESLMKVADDAMYQNKKDRLNKVSM